MSGNANVSRVLLRTILRWAKDSEGVPLAVQQKHLQRLASPQGLFECAAYYSDGAPRADGKFVASLARYEFRTGSSLQGEDAEGALDRGFQALRLLNTHYTSELERLRALRVDRSNRTGIKYSVGQVFRHRQYGYRGLIVGWDRTCERPPEWANTMGVNPNQPFYYVLPSEEDCLRLWRTIRVSKYVAEENIELLTGPDSRICHRGLQNYFVAVAEDFGRYIPNQRLQYEYPDCYTFAEEATCERDANLLLHDEALPGDGSAAVGPGQAKDEHSEQAACGASQQDRAHGSLWSRAD